MKVVISLGGSLIVPKDIEIPNDIDAGYTKRFVSVINSFSKKGGTAYIIVGGGKTARKYHKALREIVKPGQYDLDMVGIRTTELNAEFVRVVFGKSAYNELMLNPTKPPKTKKKIVIGCGWKPNSTTDKDAVLTAISTNTKTVLNLTDVDYVYDKNPKKHRDAKPIERITWKGFEKIIGKKYVSGMNVPFDPNAATLARKHNITVIIANGKNIGNLKNILSGREFRGTVIKD